ncbi:MAG: hypothetical protein JJU34_05540 [Lunatimonas sp.]|uniref:hypothetical protein n=1 Tax=Lunatimonas sp. TaxID=2060141 RepID=UPI00263BBAEF|nr:hypothetical protein [Lunatimonas sp.]MCC5936724.1 hypothetical protein [Lunatimonas sp.]
MSQQHQLTNRFTLLFVGIFLGLVFGYAGSVRAQVFTSVKNGDWQDASVWSIGDNCNRNNSTGFPPTSKNNGCAVSVLVRHHVVYNGNINNFGSGVFAGVEIASSGRLDFSGDVTMSGGGGSAPYIRMESGAELHIGGTLRLDRAVSLTIPRGAKWVVDDLFIGNSSPVVTVEEGAELIVKGETTLRTNATLNIQGKFQTGELAFSSGGTVNATGLQASIEVVNDLTLAGGLLDLNGSSKLVVGGKTEARQNGAIQMKDFATAILGQQVSFSNGSRFRLENSASFRLDEGLEMSGGARLTLAQNSSGVVVRNVTLPDGEIQTGQFSELNIGGRLTATNGSVTTVNSSAVFICDYPNSTQRSASNIEVQGDSFYGEGCVRLPVLWESVTAVFFQTQSHVRVSWTTASEKNNSHFILERSIGGIQEFTELEVIQAVGWSDLPSSYDFFDSRLPAVKGMVYYRVKQVDYDGKEVYSDVIGVQVDNAPSTSSKLIAFPNPTNGDKFQIRFEQPATAPTTISATFKSWSGSKLLKAESLEILSLMVAEEIRLAPKGICLIEVATDSQVHHLKIMKH